MCHIKAHLDLKIYSESKRVWVKQKVLTLAFYLVLNIHLLFNRVSLMGDQWNPMCLIIQMYLDDKVLIGNL